MHVGDDNKMDMHYWKHCPMLMACGSCGQVIEISGYHEHLLDECENAAQAYTAPPYNGNRERWARDMKKGIAACSCPLCHVSVARPGHANVEGKWRAHLVGQCTKNPRGKKKLMQ